MGGSLGSLKTMSANMVPVHTTKDGFEAKVMAAHLGAAGIVWQLRGSPDGIYPLGEVEVLVQHQDLLEAAALLTPAAMIATPPDL